MNWGLSQGLIGRAKNALAPSSVALGPNTYLVGHDFLKMLGVAFVVHAIAFGIYALLPGEKVTNIPVRALSFKLGGEDKIEALVAKPAATATAPNVPKPVAAPVMRAVSKDSWRATPNVPAPVVPAPLKPIVKPQPQPRVQPRPVMPVQRVQSDLPVVKVAPPQPTPSPSEVKQPRVVKVDDALARYQPPAPVAVAPQPQQYVREVGGPSPQAVAAALAQAPQTQGAAGAAGSNDVIAEQTAKAAQLRYTQEVSAWIGRHVYYPEAAGGKRGRVVVRIWIDRAGYVRYNEVEESSGNALFDETAREVVRRANPGPAVPADYPGTGMLAFTIPINFGTQ